MEKGKIDLCLDISEVNIIIKALSERPFREVYELIGKVHMQSNTQLAPKAINNQLPIIVLYDYASIAKIILQKTYYFIHCVGETDAFSAALNDHSLFASYALSTLPRSHTTPTIYPYTMNQVPTPLKKQTHYLPLLIILPYIMVTFIACNLNNGNSMMKKKDAITPLCHVTKLNNLDIQQEIYNLEEDQIEFHGAPNAEQEALLPLTCQEQQEKITPIHNQATEQAFTPVSNKEKIDVLNHQLTTHYPHSYYGATLLHQAVIDNCLERITVLLTENINLNAQDAFGSTPMHLAAKSNKNEAITLLLEKKADVNLKDKDGNTPLHLAIINKNEQAVRLLLLEEKTDVNTRDNSNSTPLHSAIIHNMEVVAALLLNQHAAINARNNDRKTPLHWAVEANNSALQKLLVRNGAAVNIQDNNGCTPLHIVVKKKNEEAITSLLGYGAAINIQDKDGHTPLHIAVKNKDQNTTKLLLRNHADVNKKDHQGYTPLHIAIKNQDKKMVILLLEKNADVNAQRHYYLYDETPLSLAAKPWNTEIIESLLVQGKNVQVNTLDKDGKTPLHRAVENKKLNIVKLLLENGANVNIPDRDHNTPLNTAAEIGDQEMMLLLLEKNTNSTKKSNTPLIWIVYLSNLYKNLFKKGQNADASVNEKVEHELLQAAILESNQEKLKPLLKKGVDVNKKNKKGSAPLHLAITTKAEEIVKLLLKYKADVNTKDQDGATPLHLAVKNNIEGIITLLVQKGADVNAKDKDGSAPLHWAGNKVVIKLLVEQGADMNAKDENGHTPLHSAIENNKKEVIAFLLENAKCADGQDKIENKNRSLVKISYLWNVYMAGLGAYMQRMVYNYSLPSRIFYRTHGYITKVFPLPEKTLDLNAKGRNGNTPLHLAIINLNKEAVTLLLEKGADINVPNMEGNTPLSLAFDKRYTNSSILIALGEKIDTSLKDSYMATTLLHWAVGHHALEIIKILLEKGVDVNVKDLNEYPPLYWAIESNDPEAVKILLEKGADITAINNNTLIALAIVNPKIENLLELYKKN
eukprot:gene2194-2700_t